MKWISVKDRLPKRPPNRTDENGRECFVVTDDFIVTDSEGRVFEACYSYANKSFWYGNSLNKIEVVAYMPLPEPYKTKMTNYDKIKSMSIEEMADCEYLNCPYSQLDFQHFCRHFNSNCHDCMIDWLKKEADNEN
ncbi:MAG: hypothetical protein ACI4EA_08080 [Candidatus Ornithomonoglobus sp.]